MAAAYALASLVSADLSSGRHPNTLVGRIRPGPDTIPAPAGVVEADRSRFHRRIVAMHADELIAGQKRRVLFVGARRELCPRIARRAAGPAHLAADPASP